MTKKANKLVAFALAVNILLLLPLAFAIHTQSHTHTFKFSTEDQWYDDSATQCKLCVNYFHQVIDYNEFSIIFSPVWYLVQVFPLWISEYTATPNVHHLRGPPVS